MSLTAAKNPFAILGEEETLHKLSRFTKEQEKLNLKKMKEKKIVASAVAMKKEETGNRWYENYQKRREEELAAKEKKNKQQPEEKQRTNNFVVLGKKNNGTTSNETNNKRAAPAAVKVTPAAVSRQNNGAAQVEGAQGQRREVSYAPVPANGAVDYGKALVGNNGGDGDREEGVNGQVLDFGDSDQFPVLGRRN